MWLLLSGVFALKLRQKLFIVSKFTCTRTLPCDDHYGLRLSIILTGLTDLQISHGILT